VKKEVAVLTSGNTVPEVDIMVDVLQFVRAAGGVAGLKALPAGPVSLIQLCDGFGRRTRLFITVILMGLASTAIGLLPSYAAIGGCRKGPVGCPSRSRWPT
jgi:MFS family permease